MLYCHLERLVDRNAFAVVDKDHPKRLEGGACGHGEDDVVDCRVVVRNKTHSGLGESDPAVIRLGKTNERSVLGP